MTPLQNIRSRWTLFILPLVLVTLVVDVNLAVAQGGGGTHTTLNECKFEDMDDMVRQVNSKGMDYAQSQGQSPAQYDSNGNGRLDGLEGQFYGSQGQLGSYKCSEFSALLACILQEMFNCTPEQVRVIEGNNHSINQLNMSMFRNPPARGDANGWADFEPQKFQSGGNVGGYNGVGSSRRVYNNPQPYRSGINNTIYDELGCKSGPGYSEGGGGGGGGFGGGGGLFGGLGGSLFLSQMISSMMKNLNGGLQNNATLTPSPIATAIVIAGTPSPTPIPVPTSTPTAAPTATATATIAIFSTPIPTTAPNTTPDYVPTVSRRSLDAMGDPKSVESFFSDELSDGKKGGSADDLSLGDDRIDSIGETGQAKKVSANIGFPEGEVKLFP